MNKKQLYVSRVGEITADLDTTEQYYVEGWIIDQNGKPLDKAFISIVINATGKQVSDPVLIQGGSYSAWTNKSPYELAVLFTADGFESRKIQISKLIEAPDVVMKASGAIKPWQIALVIAAIAVIEKKSGKKLTGFDTGTVLTIFLLLAGLMAFGLIDKILKLLGFTKDPTTDEQSDAQSAFKPSYWQQFTTFTYAITESQARDYARTIHNAFTLFQDDYNQIKGVFSAMRTKANVSFLAWVFQKEYNEDLLTFLTDGGGLMPWDGLSAAHLKTILDSVHALPKN